MQLNLDKEDLRNMIKGCRPNYSVMENPIVKKCGHYVGGFNDEWSWNYNFGNDFSEEELYNLYMICKNSWNIIIVAE